MTDYRAVIDNMFECYMDEEGATVSWACSRVNEDIDNLILELERAASAFQCVIEDRVAEQTAIDSAVLELISGIGDTPRKKLLELTMDLDDQKLDPSCMGGDIPSSEIHGICSKWEGKL